MANPDPSPETRFKPGQSGNPGGRPANRDKLASRLTEDLLAVWEEKGIAALRQLSPEALSTFAASQLPRDPQKASIEHKHSGSVEHVGISETARWIEDTLRGRAEGPPPESLPN